MPETSPFHSLYQSVNETVQALADANQRMVDYQRELESKLDTIERQRAAIRELSTPVIELWEGVLCMPIVGVLDTSRSGELNETLLTEVVQRRARCAIIDITGIEVMDTATADHFVRMAKAIRLLGSRCILTGLRPAIAQTIVEMGIGLEGLDTHRTLRDALRELLSPGTGQKSG